MRKIRADPDWRAAAHILSVRERDTWAKKHHLELTGKDEGPIGVRLFLPELEAEDDADGDS